MPKSEMETTYLDPGIQVNFTREEIEEEIKRQEKLFPSIILKDPSEKSYVSEQFNDNMKQISNLPQFKEDEQIIRDEKIITAKPSNSQPKHEKQEHLEIKRSEVKPDPTGTFLVDTNKRNLSTKKTEERRKQIEPVFIKSPIRSTPLASDNLSIHSSKTIQFEVPIERTGSVKPSNNPVDLQKKSVSKENLKQAVINAAIEAKRNAIVKYSKYRVGCALLTEDNNIITGNHLKNFKRIKFITYGCFKNAGNSVYNPEYRKCI